MALTYQESADLMRDPVFISRIKVACLHFATYISGEAPTVPAHKTRVSWAEGVMGSPAASCLSSSWTRTCRPAVRLSPILTCRPRLRLRSMTCCEEGERHGS